MFFVLLGDETYANEKNRISFLTNISDDIKTYEQEFLSDGTNSSFTSTGFNNKASGSELNFTMPSGIGLGISRSTIETNALDLKDFLRSNGHFLSVKHEALIKFRLI